MTMTKAERAAAFERARVEQGGRVARLCLRPEAAAALDSLRERWGCTMLAAVERALTEADARGGP